VNIRVRAVGKVTPPPLVPYPHTGPNVEHALIDRRMVRFSDMPIETSFYQGEKLRHGNRISGPAVILRTDTTILLGISDQALCDPFLNIHIEVGD
jgi:N-methylhydantoinase A